MRSTRRVAVAQRAAASNICATSSGRNGGAVQAVSTHAALVVPAPGQMLVESVQTKAPQAGEMLVAPLYTGICGSDLDVLRGVRPSNTRILGHEGVAEVVAVGPGVTDFSIGQHVTFWPNNPNDLDDVLGVSTEGLFQQRLLISRAAMERGMVLPLDAGISLVCAPLLEPFATVIYGQRLIEQVRTPESLMIVGAGPIGLLNALYARARGCPRVFLVDTSQARLDWAASRGIVDDSHVLLSSSQLADIVLERTAGRGVDAACLCTPRSSTRSALAQALRYVREEGCIELAAGVASREELPELPGVDLNAIRDANVCGLGHLVSQHTTRAGKRLWLTGHSGASAHYLHEAMHLVLNEPASYARIISHVVSYRAAPRVIEQLLSGRSPVVADAPRVKVIVDFTNDAEQIDAFDPTAHGRTNVFERLRG